jgi:hypothetical protein
VGTLSSRTHWMLSSWYAGSVCSSLTSQSSSAGAGSSYAYSTPSSMEYNSKSLCVPGCSGGRAAAAAAAAASSRATVSATASLLSARSRSSRGRLEYTWR